MNSIALFRLDRLAVLEFYDTRPADSSKHATAINAVMGEDLGAGLMKHYLVNKRGAAVTIHNETCTPGTKKGGRLDCWISVKWSDLSAPTLFQVEIKNWSAHSYGGKKLSLQATPEDIKKHKVERWVQLWDEDNKLLKPKEVQKVLTPMKTSQSGVIETVLCMWDAMHPAGEEEPWFAVTLPEGGSFSQLWVFSMSAYLRTLDEPYIEIEMPETLLRLQWLNKFVSKASAKNEY